MAKILFQVITFKFYSDANERDNESSTSSGSKASAKKSEAKLNSKLLANPKISRSGSKLEDYLQKSTILALFEKYKNDEDLNKIRSALRKLVLVRNKLPYMDEKEKENSSWIIESFNGKILETN